MAKGTEILAKRIHQKLDELGLSARAVSLEATKKPDAIREIERGKEPGAARLAAIAQVLNTTVDWLTGQEATEQQVMSDQSLSFRGFDQPRDVPVVGSALGHDLRLTDDGEVPIELHMVDMGVTVDYLRRPPSIRHRPDVYGVTVVGDSMHPRFRPGEPVYVDPKKTPQIGDDVIVQLVQQDEIEGQLVVAALIKTLARRSSSFIELEQYTPAARFRLPSEMVLHIHRVIPWGELMGM